MLTVKIGEMEVAYDLQGEGETLLFFPDNLLTGQAYKSEIEHFSTRFQVLTFDYPGSGRSTHQWFYPDEQEVDFWGFRADMACHLLMELKISRCYVIGVGGGAMAALHFAGKQAPQHHITTLGVVADSFLADWDGRTLHRWLDVREHFYVRNGKALQQLHGDDWRQVVDADTTFIRQLADRGGYAVPDGYLNAIPCPVLLTGQTQDQTLPGIAREYARLSAIIPDCRLFLSSSQNHPSLERPFLRSDPKRFRHVVDYFLAQISAD
ncbi:MAG: alpha/beta fold hydrolase [Anaerolineales bacterium]|nr:alpha/beta fold hydrolase [Anaerolineales bacterium]